MTDSVERRYHFTEELGARRGYLRHLEPTSLLDRYVGRRG